MATQKESQIVVNFDEGVVNSLVEDVAEGAIRQSINTRLTVDKGAVAKAPSPVQILDIGEQECGGIIPSGRDSAAIYFKRGVTTSSRWTSGTVEQLKALDTNVGQNAYYPYPIVEAGSVPGSTTMADPVVVVDSQGRAWHFLDRDGSIRLTVLDGDDILFTPQTVMLSTSSLLGATLQVHSAVEKVVLWFTIGASVRYCAMTLASDATLTIGSTTTLFTPANPELAIGSLGTDAFAYVYYQRTASLVAMVKVNTSTGSTTFSADVAGTISAIAPHFAVSVFEYLGVGYVAGVVGQLVEDTSMTLWNTSTMVEVWSHVSDAIGNGRVAVAPYITDTDAWVVTASDVYDSNYVSAPAQTAFRFYTVATGLFASDVVVPWTMIQAKATYAAVGLNRYPYFPLMQVYADDATEAGQTGYVSDPAVHLWAPDGRFNMSPVVRCGVDRAFRFNADQRQLSSSSISVQGSELTYAYLEQRTDGTRNGMARFGMATAGLNVRFVTVDISPRTQPAYSHDNSGGTVIASGLTAHWDGAETTEHTPLHRPLVWVDATGGTTGNNLTGTYAFTATISWRDSNGVTHRAAPAFPVSIVLAGTQPTIHVAVPASMRNGVQQEYYDVILYSTLAGGSLFYSQAAAYSSGAVDGILDFTNLLTPHAGGNQLFSTGGSYEPLLPECPPPSHDAKAIGPRMWLIDAENRQRALPSLPKEDGIAYEFNGALAINFPATRGKLVGLADLNGTPLFFAERGVWTVGGYGPDNTGNGGFTDPTLLTTRGCKARETIVSVPGVGVLFQADDSRFCLFAGGAVKSFDFFGPYEVGAPIVFGSANEVVYPLRDSAGFVVYNWLKDGWTEWAEGIEDVPTTAIAVGTEVDGEAQVLLYAADLGLFATMNSAGQGTGNMVLERAWMAPESSQGDCVIRQVFLQCINAGAHGVTVTMSFDYNDSNTIVREWSASEITSLTVGGRYTIGVDCQAKDVRSVKIYLAEDMASETFGDCMRPLNATITYGASAGPRQRTMKAGALK